MLTKLEEKLLRLALDPNTSLGEIETAAKKLVMSWRERGLKVEDFGLKRPIKAGEHIHIQVSHDT